MTLERAVLAGGCFWGMQDLIRKLPGVVSTRVGYTGGSVKNATYRNHEGHAEAIEINFDPSKTSFRELLEFFFQIHDPSTLNRQGNDDGTSYRSAIFYTSDDQKKIAVDTIADVDASGIWPGEVVTQVEPIGEFWEAEPEHQDYLERIPCAAHAFNGLIFAAELALRWPRSLPISARGLEALSSGLAAIRQVDSLLSTPRTADHHPNTGT